jgi:transcriptional regulator with XRE-family HTH domain
MNARELVAWNTRRVRVSRGISSEALARDAGADRAYVSRIERAVANASIDVLERIARVLEVGMTELFAVPEPHESALSRSVVVAAGAPDEEVVFLAPPQCSDGRACQGDS